MWKELRVALTLFGLLTVLTGVLYPGVVTLAGNLIFPDEAAGSPLLGQSFTSARYFWGRPSATGPFPDNGAVSSGSNQAATNPALIAAVKDRVAALRAADPGNTRLVPVDLVTASGSGLDPEISPAAAEYQVGRVARARGMDEAAVRSLVAAATKGRTFGLLGEPRVDVLQLNLALNALEQQAK